MNQEDQAFLEKLRATFRIEAEEHVNNLTQCLLLLEKNITDEQRQEAIEKIFREAHSLKGASRAVNHGTIQEVCQVMEDLFSKWKQDTLPLSPNLFDTLHKAIELLTSELTGTASSKDVNAVIASLSNELNSTKAAPQKEHSVVEKNDPPPQKIEENNEKAPPSQIIDKTIRISSSKLDHVFQGVEELLMIKLNTRQEMETIKGMFDTINRQEKELSIFISEMQVHRQTQETEYIKKTLSFFEKHQAKIKSLSKQLKRNVKNAQQNVHFVDSMVDTLLEDVKKILMQPISSLCEIFPRMVREIARSLGKEIHLEIHGADIEVDRRILEEIKDPIIHIIRNAIDHGIEMPSERTKKGKNPIGKIIITASENHGNTVLLTIADDGQGINIEKLKAVALDKKMITAEEAANLTFDNAIKLAFQSGVSTSPIITSISGRGIGLGVVTEKVDKLGGTITIDSTPNQGTLFKFILPLTMATFRGVHITIEGEDFIMPAQNVLRVMRIQEEHIKTVEGFETLTVNGHALSFSRLSHLLELKKKPKSSETKNNLFALVVKAEEKTIALGVDYIHQEHEVLLKSLGSQCPRVKNVMAATIMDWGKVIPILNPIDLMRTALKGNRLGKHIAGGNEKATIKKVVLLVEDSITTRLLFKNILESSGYEVRSAADGIEALEIIKTEPIDLLLTDVDMPLMDGFTLAEKVRSTDALKDIPIIICTARESNEDRLRGIEIGADAYLNKNSFNQQSLLSLTKKLL